METKIISSEQPLSPFWTTLDSIPLTLTEKLKKLKQKSYQDSTNNLKNRLIHIKDSLSHEKNSSKSKDFEIHKLSSIIQRLPEYKDEKLKIIEIKEKISTRQELKHSIIQIQQSFQKESIDLNTQRDQMYEIFSEKRKLLNQMVENLKNQNNLIRTSNLTQSDFAFNEIDFNLEQICNDLRDEIKSYSHMVSSVTIIHDECKKEAEIAIQKVENTDDELKKLKDSHETEMKRLEENIGKKENLVNMETEAIRAEFERYKMKIEQELLVRNLVEERQKSFIEHLMEELRNMKLVLQHPTLRMKTYERIRETMTPTGFASTLPKINTHLLQVPRSGFTSKMQSGYLSTRSNKSTRRTKSSFKN